MKAHAANLIEMVSTARVAAVRWDVVPWSVVLDLDVHDWTVGEIHRGWAIFSGLSTLEIQMKDSRLPIGFWISGCEVEVSSTFETYRINAQLPRYLDDKPIFDLPQILTIRSQSSSGIISQESALSNEYRILDYENRQTLCSDEFFLQTYNQGLGV